MAIKGLDKLFRSLDIERAVEVGIEKGIARSAELVLQTAKFYCPVDTGALRESIRAEISKTGFEVGTDLYYAKFVEFGTSKQRPQPYLYPAIAENKDKIVNIIQEEIRKELGR